MITCSKCSQVKADEQFPSIGKVCRECKAEYQRRYRADNANLCTKQYEKSKKGFLMRAYRNMKSRIEGVQKAKHYLYVGKSLLSKEAFYQWAENDAVFNALFKTYEDSFYDRKLAPSPDRMDSKLGYEIGNIEWVTHSENSRRGTLSKMRKFG